MELIKTIVLLDLETSGLPKDNPCKITEIALVAASRQHIIDRHLGVSKENDVGLGNTFLPRVLNKLNCVVYPCKMIHPMASEVSGLTNTCLEDQKPFDDKLFEMINNFIERLEKPICLVAHNGNNFDFPLLNSEISKIKKTLPDYVYCADSLAGFREVLRNHQTQTQEGVTQEPDNYVRSDAISGIKPLNNKVCFDPCSTLPKCGWSNDEYDNELVQAVDNVDQLNGDQSSFDVSELGRKISIEMERIQKMNERTPVRPRYRKQVVNKFDSINPNGNQAEKETSAKRRIVEEKQPKRKFNLNALYQSLTKKEFVNAHQAEADALALLECVTAVGRPILEWFDNNKIPFRSVKRMW